MKRRNRIHRKKERTFHRWLAWFMAAVLFMGECNLSVLAEEGTPDIELLDETAFDEVLPEEPEEVDEDSTDDTDELPDDEDSGAENICICDILCGEDSVNEDCPVCVADYGKCSGQEESELPEILKENEEAIEVATAEAAVSENEGIEAYADVNKIKYSVIDGTNEVEVIGHEDGTAVGGRLEIPGTVNGYRVTRIAANAFFEYTNLTSIVIPPSVTSIGAHAFTGCMNLTSVNIPNGVTSIGESTFATCTSLTSIEIPNSVTSIGDDAFLWCTGLTSIKIPNSVTSIAISAFKACGGLTSVKIPNSVENIGNMAFQWCGKLSKWQIIVPTDGTQLRIPKVGDEAFSGVGTDIVDGDKPSIEFYEEDGTTKLTGEPLSAAQTAYRDDNDGTPGNDYWYKWKIGGESVSSPSTVTITVQKDGSDWSGKTFGLKPAGNPDAALITDFSSAADGTYDIYDIADAASAVNIGKTITVNGGAGNAVINYYTATFYDGKIPYGTDTPQAPQILLEGSVISEPGAPPRQGRDRI